MIEVLGVASSIFAVCWTVSVLLHAYQLIEELTSSARLERLAKERRSGKGGEPHV